MYSLCMAVWDGNFISSCEFSHHCTLCVGILLCCYVGIAVSETTEIVALFILGDIDRVRNLRLLGLLVGIVGCPMTLEVSVTMTSELAGF